MTRLAAVLVGLGAVLATGCGRTDLGGGPLDEHPSGGDAGFGTGADGGPLALCDPAGVRVCGAGCPELITPDSSTFDVDASDVCPGYGCTPTEDIHDYTSQPAGVCWADAQQEAKYVCGTCRDGEVCLQRSQDELVCVPEDVCRALWTLGVRDVCRYADFHPYDGRAVPSPTGACPVAGTIPPRICSGSCAPCPDGERCVGRSPDHPFGLCRDDFIGSLDPQPSNFQTCSICLTALGPNASNYACAVFDTAPADRSLAIAGGFCMPLKDCLKIGPILPGGVSCYDISGQRLGP